MYYTDEYFMREALKEAQKAFEEGEVPIGAIAVFENKIIARSHNLTEKLKDCTAHAEILCVTTVNEIVGSKYLHNISIYVSLEPCVMCAGALFWSQINKLIYAAEDEKRGFSKFGNLLHPKTEIIKGILKKDSENLMKEFFLKVRQRNK
ncbi:MAG: nucleoside deaminase [Bacteroidales bacterium]|jgi:tRNA(adenine34) deaminase|nr:nucleoside deaminase [Bacteroidales bacterium]